MELLIFFVALAVFSEILAEALPHLLRLAGMLVYYLCRGLWETCKLLAHVTVFLAAAGAGAIFWAGGQGWLFLAILLDEWRHGPKEAQDGPCADTECEAAQAAYAAALSLLGMQEPFAAADLKRVYRQAMKTAHTDVGGTKDAALALNAARDLVLAVKGWK